MEIVFATGNKGKIKEVKKIFKNSGITILSENELGKFPEIEETGQTFEENAFIKAEAIFKLFGKPVIADDSGLVVDQLDGQPGVYSARYAGENCTYEDNNRKLISELKEFPNPHHAKFVCCSVYFDGTNKLVENGELIGEIVDELKGQNGFGYDPVFQADGFEITMAEMDLEMKNSLSHRGKAFKKLKNKIVREVSK